jgi:murein DD-endopeptidase MepM/ murein hydrolase activator NlpD
MAPRIVAVVLLAAVASACAPSHRPVQEPISIPARPLAEAGEERRGELAAPEEAGVYHIVLPGQTLWRIARTYGFEPEELAEANGIDDPARLRSGQTLFVPGATAVLEVPPYQEAVGTTAAPAATDWSWPVQAGEVLSYFGAPRGKRRHAGVDIGGRHGQTVVASRAGRVVASRSDMRGYGKTVILDHGDGFRSLYAHNSKLLVRPGQRVERGQPIARVGRTGNASTEHCHFEIRHNARPVDPLLFLRPPLEARR